MHSTPIPTFHLVFFSAPLCNNTKFILQIDSCDYDRGLSMAAMCLIRIDWYFLERHFRLAMTSIKANYDISICTF